MKVPQLLQLLWMGVGRSVATNTPTMRSPGLVLKLETRQVNFCILEYVISTIVLVLVEVQYPTMSASRIGVGLHQKWRVTSFLRVFFKLKEYMGSATPNL